LEDLLRLKRAERPAPEFWEGFERELRAKQLAAIVQKQPWWRSMSFARLVRYRVALGACAVLTLTFVSLREYRQKNVPVSAPVLAAVTEVAAPDVADVSEDLSTLASRAIAARPVSDQLAGVVSVGGEGVQPVNQVEESAASAPTSMSPMTGVISQAVSWVSAGEQPSGDLSPTAKSIADNLAAAEEAHPELTRRFFGSLGGFEKRGMPATRQVTDPLAQMKSPADLHRERLLARALPAASINSRAAERIARGISDERLTEDAISRFGARGDRVLVKF